jgi:hypothetical protein
VTYPSAAARRGAEAEDHRVVRHGRTLRLGVVRCQRARAALFVESALCRTVSTSTASSSATARSRSHGILPPSYATAALVQTTRRRARVAYRLCAVSATRPITLTRDQLAALLGVLERWEVEAETGRLLRLALTDELD